MNNTADTDLARRAASGDLSAWHQFVLRYSGLIRVMVRRYYFGWPEDDQLNLYVTVLDYMYAEGLHRYDGRAALATWVMTVTRSRCLDAVRHELGRRRLPTWLKGLSPLEQEIYRLHFIDFRSPPEILNRLHGSGHAMEPEELEKHIDVLVARMDRASQKRAAYDLQARSVGILCGRVLEIMDSLRLEMEGRAETSRPDHELFQEQTRRLLEEVEDCVGRLGSTERRVIELHFYEEVSAPGIARRLNLPGARHVYTVINRALGLLREMLAPSATAPLGRGPGSSVKHSFRR